MGVAPIPPWSIGRRSSGAAVCLPLPSAGQAPYSPSIRENFPTSGSFDPMMPHHKFEMTDVLAVAGKTGASKLFPFRCLYQSNVGAPK